MVPAADAVRIESSLPHGHVAAVHTMAHTLGLPALLGPACRARDLAYALIVSRVLTPGSKLSTLTGWANTTLGADLAVTGAASDEVYAPRPAPTTSTPRWTGWSTGRTRSRPGWPAATWPPSRTRPGWRCSTCPARG
jgi:hypothetical protein